MAGRHFESYKPTYHDTDAVYGLPNEQVSLLSTGYWQPSQSPAVYPAIGFRTLLTQLINIQLHRTFPPQ